MAGVEQFAVATSTIEVAVERFPLVKVTLMPPLRDEDLTAFEVNMRRLAFSGRKYAVVTTAHGVADLTVVQRRRLAELSLQVEEMTRTNLVLSAVVIRSSLARGMLTAINWIAPPKYPQRVVASEAAAEQIALQALQAAGLATAPVARAL